MEGFTLCKACSHIKVNATWLVTNPAPWCQWSQSSVPP